MLGEAMNEAQASVLNLLHASEIELNESESEVIVQIRPLRKLGNHSMVNLIKSDKDVLEAILRDFFIENNILYRVTAKGKTKVSLKKAEANTKAKVKVSVSFNREPEISVRNVVYMLHTKACVPDGKVVKLHDDDEESRMSSLVFDNMYLTDSSDTSNIFSFNIPSKTPERFTGLSGIRRLPDVFSKNSNFRYKHHAGEYYLMTADNTIDYKSFHKDWRVVLNQKLSVGVWYMPEKIKLPDIVFQRYMPWINEIYDTLRSLDIAPGYHINTIVFQAEEQGKERVYTWRPKKDSLLPVYTAEYNATSIPDDLYYLCVKEGIEASVIHMNDFTLYTSDSDVRREFVRNHLSKLGEHAYDMLRFMLIEILRKRNEDIPLWLNPLPRATYRYFSLARDYSLQDPDMVFVDMKHIVANARNPKHMAQAISDYFSNEKRFPLYDVEQTGVDMQTSNLRPEHELKDFRRELA